MHADLCGYGLANPACRACTQQGQNAQFTSRPSAQLAQRQARIQVQGQSNTCTKTNSRRPQHSHQNQRSKPQHGCVPALAASSVRRPAGATAPSSPSLTPSLRPSSLVGASNKWAEQCWWTSEMVNGFTSDHGMRLDSRIVRATSSTLCLLLPSSAHSMHHTRNPYT